MIVVRILSIIVAFALFALPGFLPGTATSFDNYQARFIDDSANLYLGIILIGGFVFAIIKAVQLRLKQRISNGSAFFISIVPWILVALPLSELWENEKSLDFAGKATLLWWIAPLVVSVCLSALLLARIRKEGPKGFWNIFILIIGSIVAASAIIFISKALPYYWADAHKGGLAKFLVSAASIIYMLATLALPAGLISIHSSLEERRIEKKDIKRAKAAH